MNKKEIETVISFIENLRILGSNITGSKEVLAAGTVLSRPDQDILFEALLTAGGHRDADTWDFVGCNLDALKKAANGLKVPSDEDKTMVVNRCDIKGKWVEIVDAQGKRRWHFHNNKSGNDNSQGSQYTGKYDQKELHERGRGTVNLYDL
jgi:hypothetical protein